MKTDVKTVTLAIGTVLVATLLQFSFGADCGSNGFACTSCTTLQICTNNVASGVNLTCPDGTYCSVSSASFCTADECSDLDTTTTDATTTEATTSEPFNCTTEGRFANTSDTTCQSYYFCFLNGTSYSLWELTCPTTTIFNPTTATCVANTDYTCSTESTTESTTTTTTTAATTTTTAATTTTTAATTTTTEFSCSAYGRFPDTTDSTCQSYYFCYLDGSSYTILQMTCPTTTVFNPTTAKCVASTDYTCTN